MHESNSKGENIGDIDSRCQFYEQHFLHNSVIQSFSVLAVCVFILLTKINWQKKPLMKCCWNWLQHTLLGTRDAFLFFRLFSFSCCPSRHSPSLHGNRVTIAFSPPPLSSFSLCCPSHHRFGSMHGPGLDGPSELYCLSMWSTDSYLIFKNGYLNVLSYLCCFHPQNRLWNS